MFGLVLERIAAELDRRSIPYMVIGGQAVLVHGEPRLTRDIDVTLGMDTDRLPELEEAARALGLQTLVDPRTFTPRTMVLPCLDPATGVRVDFILSFSPFEAEALRRAVTLQVGATPVRFVGVEDLVILKVVAGRPRDLEDARVLLHRHRSVDRTLIERWLRELGRALGADFLGAYRSLLPPGT